MSEIRFEIWSDVDGVIFRKGLLPIKGAIGYLRKLMGEHHLATLTARSKIFLLIGKITVKACLLSFVKVKGANGNKADVLRNRGRTIIFLDNKMEELKEVQKLKDEGVDIHIFQACFCGETVPEGVPWRVVCSWRHFYDAVKTIEQQYAV